MKKISEKVYLIMENKKNKWILILSVLLFSVALVISFLAWQGYQLEKEKCFSQLTSYTDQIGRQSRISKSNNYSGKTSRKRENNCRPSGGQFEGEKIFRIGGDEFVILCQNWDKQKMQDQIERAKEELKASGYEISVGISWKTGSYSINELINEAEDEMRQNKQEFYEKGGKERNFRCLNHKMEELIASKKEADVILSVLQPGFGGVYFVNLDQDTLRHVFIPEYFREIVEECKGVFSKSLLEYGKRMVVEEYYSQFEQVCNYDWLKKQLMQGKQPSETSSSTTLWIFENK